MRKRISSSGFFPNCPACRRLVGPEMTKSPRKIPSFRACLPSHRGKESTSVGRSMPRNFRFKRRMDISPTKVISRSEWGTASSLRIVVTASRIVRSGILTLVCRFFRIILLAAFSLAHRRDHLQLDGQRCGLLLLDLRILDALMINADQYPHEAIGNPSKVL